MQQIPTPGQLVTVRNRRFVVTGVEASTSQLDLYAELAAQSAQHLVSLQSVEDDGAGEELEVIWEIEPGTQVYEKATLPDPTKGFDEPARLGAFLDAVRWGAVASADVQHLSAPFRSGITIEDYQLDPVVRALSMPRVSLLIADDVGLGKTIEAGLVVQELILRNRARTVLVVCPAGLQIQWRDQMREKFGLEFRIVDSELMKELRRRRGLHVNPWTHFPRLITSMDFIKRDRPLRLMKEALPAEGAPAFPRRFDLLIVDEAHNVAPAGRGNIALDTLRTQAIRTVAKHFEHKLFLTATPHNGFTESFSALLELLDDQRFMRTMAPDETQKAAVMVRRLKKELPPDDLGRPRFRERTLEALEVPYTAEEKRIHRVLQQYAAARLDGAEGGVEALATEFVVKLLKKRLFSSPEAFRITLEKHAKSIQEGRAKRRRKSVKSPGLLRREIGAAEEESSDDAAYEERAGEVVAETTAVFRPLSAEEEKLVAELQGWAARAAGRPDTKAKRLVAWLNDTLRPGGKWNDNRVIVFTEYRATQNWLEELLAAEGLSKGDRLMTLYGGMPTEDRERVKAAFQADPEVSSVRILLATDAASEGIDLQKQCSRLIHYEIPWNPNRLEQRNGRVDRHGQKHDVQVFHFVGENYEDSADPRREPGELEGDLEFLMRAARKIEQIRDDLGSAGDVIAEQVEQAMLGRRKRLDAEQATRRAEKVRAALRTPLDIRQRIQTLLAKLKESKAELRVSPEHLKAVVDVGLELAGHPPLRAVDVAARDGVPALTAYELPALAGTWAACADGLAHPYTGDIRPVVFDHDLGAERDDVVVAHMGHRLVQMCVRLLRAEVWAPEGSRNLHRVSAAVVSDDALDHPAVVAHARLVVLGKDGARLHEEILTAGGSIKSGRFARLNVGETRQVLEAIEKSTRPAPAAARAQLARLWDEHAPAVLGALEARQKQRAEGLEKLLAERAEREVRDITHVLAELRKAILAKLEEAEPAQLELFSSEERDQVQRNADALRARADAVPAEIERESKAIRDRYSEPTPRLFPVAVTYAIPASLARGGAS
ncbi:MAG: DEAD/DEAH box helicase [Polyangiaceae bacterium]|nr:DISARM system SNF2-like helicase DrmD [Polyangiaceae bacterium]NUQ76440.1 DEAD/DEAH box helicase [Polyangiaceae bacterium]